MISVLMSTFNENNRELHESIDSVLAQDYSDFEFIIVVDNPENKMLIDTLKEYKNIDPRIKILVNEKNIGLAMSLNRAASEALGDIYVRMDADDIAYPYRFSSELAAINEGADLVCSTYDIIDENSAIISRNNGFYEDQSLKTVLPYEIAIHHPTVMMKREMFENVGGYRNFICAQDYDLWLRLWCQDISIKLLNLSTLQYRYRMNSTTSKKKYVQKCTIDYIIDLFHERLQNGHDSYSYEDYLLYLDSKGANNIDVTNKFLKQHTTLVEANHYIRNGNVVKGLFLRMMVFISSGSYRSSYLNKLVTRIKIRNYNKKYNNAQKNAFINSKKGKYIE